jgi:hypothetical protein
MRFRKLRIAWSVVWTLVCALLTVLWVRSYWVHDVVQIIVLKRAAEFWSAKGEVFLNIYSESDHGFFRIEHFSFDVDSFIWQVNYTLAGFYIGKDGDVWLVRTPFWFVVPLAAAIITVPWLHKHFHFTLRTLLIATTLFALLLGLVVYASR